MSTWELARYCYCNRHELFHAIFRTCNMPLSPQRDFGSHLEINQILCVHRRCVAVSCRGRIFVSAPTKYCVLLSCWHFHFKCIIQLHNLPHFKFVEKMPWQLLAKIAHCWRSSLTLYILLMQSWRYRELTKSHYCECFNLSIIQCMPSPLEFTIFPFFQLGNFQFKSKFTSMHWFPADCLVWYWLAKYSRVSLYVSLGKAVDPPRLIIVDRFTEVIESTEVMSVNSQMLTHWYVKSILHKGI